MRYSVPSVIFLYFSAHSPPHRSFYKESARWYCHANNSVAPSCPSTRNRIKMVNSQDIHRSQRHFPLFFAHSPPYRSYTKSHQDLTAMHGTRSLPLASVQEIIWEIVKIHRMLIFIVFPSPVFALPPPLRSYKTVQINSLGRGGSPTRSAIWSCK